MSRKQIKDSEEGGNKVDEESMIVGFFLLLICAVIESTMDKSELLQLRKTTSSGTLDSSILKNIKLQPPQTYAIPTPAVFCPL